MIYTGEENEAAWIFQGLRHIIGIQEWPAYNKAKLLVKLLENEKLTLTEVGKKFGLSSYGTAQWARGYYAFKQALEESDYTEEIDEKAYPYLQEIFGRSNTAFREWLMWNDRKYRFEDELKFNEFLSWLYPRDEINELDEIEVKGKWECRVLKRSDDLRILSSLLRNSMKDFEMFREDKDLEKARSQASMQKYLKSTVKEHKTIININECIKALEDIPLKLVKEQGEKLSELLLELEQKVSEILEVYKFL